MKSKIFLQWNVDDNLLVQKFLVQKKDLRTRDKWKSVSEVQPNPGNENLSYCIEISNIQNKKYVWRVVSKLNDGNQTVSSTLDFKYDENERIEQLNLQK